MHIARKLVGVEKKQGNLEYLQGETIVEVKLNDGQKRYVALDLCHLQERGS